MRRSSVVGDAFRLAADLRRPQDAVRDLTRLVVRKCGGRRSVSRSLREQRGRLPGPGAADGLLPVRLHVRLGPRPDGPTQRRRACLLTLIFGTAGLFGGTFLALMSQAARVPDDWIGWGIGLGAFAVYFSAFVFLVRFHARVAQAFGNRWLARECLLFLFVPIFVVAGNVWIERFRFVPPFFAPPDILELSRTLCNFAVAVWYVTIVLRDVSHDRSRPARRLARCRTRRRGRGRSGERLTRPKGRQ